MAIEFESADMGPAWGVGGWGRGDTQRAAARAPRDMHLACALRRLARSGLRPISPDIWPVRPVTISCIYCTAHPGVRERCGVPRVRALAPCAERALGLARAICEHVSLRFTHFTDTPLTLK